MSGRSSTCSRQQFRDLFRLACSPLDPPLADAADVSDPVAQKVIQTWTAAHTPYEVMWACQSLRHPRRANAPPEEMLDDPHLRARGRFATVAVPGFPLFPVERRPAKFSSIPRPGTRACSALRPAHPGGSGGVARHDRIRDRPAHPAGRTAGGLRDVRRVRGRSSVRGAPTSSLWPPRGQWPQRGGPEITCSSV